MEGGPSSSGGRANINKRSAPPDSDEEKSDDEGELVVDEV